MNLISIVVPVFNEQENLKQFYEQLTNAVQRSSYNIELLLVDDGSIDRSWEIIQVLAHMDDRVKGIGLSKNSGSYAAIEAGFTYAQGDAIMCISADLQDPPAIINKFLPLWKDGYDVVWGVRDGRDDPFFKSLLARLFYWLIRKTTFSDFPNDGMDIGLFDRRIIDAYLKIQDRNSIPFFTIYSMGFRQARVPYHRKKRIAGESGWPFWKRIKCAIDVIVSFSYVPIRLIAVVGMISSGLSFLYGLLILGLRLFKNSSMSGWSSLAALIVFIGGIQMVFLSIIAEYLWRTNDRVNNRPVFFVMRETSKERK